MAYDFKNLSEIPAQDKPTENTTVMAFESGNPRQIPAGEFGGKGLVVDLRSYTLNKDNSPTQISEIIYDPIYEKITSGGSVVFIIKGAHGDYYINYFTMILDSTGLIIYTYEERDGVDYELVFPNGSYHTTT